MTIKGENIILRPIEENDLGLLLKLINDSEIRKMTVGESQKVTMAQQKEWFKHLSQSKDVRFIVASINNDIPLGTVIINEIDTKNKKCSLGIKLDKSAQGKGIGTESINLVKKYIFNDLGIHRIHIRILEENIQSIKLFEKCGFKYEGKETDSVIKDGHYRNLVCYALISGSEQ